MKRLILLAMLPLATYADTTCTRVCLDDACTYESVRCTNGDRGTKVDLGDGYSTERWETEDGPKRCTRVCLDDECSVETVRCD